MNATPPITSPETPVYVEQGPQDVHCFSLPMPFRPRMKMHYHDAHELYLCDEAGGYQHTRDTVIPMRRNQAYFFPAGVPHCGNGMAHGNSRGIVLTVREGMFTGGHGDDSAKLFARLIELHGPEKPLLDITSKTGKQLRKLMQLCDQETAEHAPGFRAKLRAYVLDMLTLFARDERLGPRLKEALTPLGQEERLAPVLRYCTIHFREPVRIEELARLAYLGRSQFHALFLKEVGHSPIEHIARLRIAEAQRLLANGDRSVLEIAMEVGYGSLGHFYKQFNRIAGCPPASYAMSLR